jgi:hypothetical protein
MLRPSGARAANIAGYYKHWGTYTGPWYNLNSTSKPEPNNLDTPPEECGAADYLSRYVDANATEAGWGWADANCNEEYPLICRYKPGGRLAGRRAHGAQGGLRLLPGSAP